MKEEKCVRYKETTLPNGMKNRTGFLINAYTIEDLPPLTREEIKTLAAEQAARGSID